MRFHSRFGLGVAIAGFAARLYGMPPVVCSPAPALRSAASFAVLGGSSVTVSSTGPTIITGNLGVSPGNTITGSPTVKIGATYRNDSVAQQAQKDAAAAYNELAGQTCGVGLTGDLGGRTLTPGVYYFSWSATLTGPLILNAQNDPNAVWIFRIGGSLTTDTNSSVLIINGGHESNIFWQVGDSAVLGAHTAFLGNVLARKDITLNDAANVSGRLLAQGAVTLNGNNVSLCCGLITLSPAALPDGMVGTQYGPITITASGGLERYTFTSSPNPPLPEMTLSSDGVLSGIPTAAGSYTFTVTATDSTHVCSGSQTYKINISCPGITVLPSAMPPSPSVPYVLPPATACIPYTPQPFGAIGGTMPYTFSLTATGPAGGPGPADLTGAQLKWTPAKSGKYTFIVTATDKLGCSGSQLYEVVVAASCAAISILPVTLLPGQVCAPYNEPITVTGCNPPYVLTLASGMLPPGLMGPSPGNAIVGTPWPTKPGTYPFTIKATDPGDPSCFTTRDYTIVITCPDITISPPVLLPATTCQFYCVKLTASCEVGATQFDVTAGALPPGLPLSPDGMLCGKPTLAGTYTWTVTFTDSVSGCTGSRTYTLPVTGVTITPPTLPPAPLGAPYSEVITASGGTAPYTLTESGMLPPVLMFTQTTPTTATISGTPTMTGCFPITVTAKDFNGCVASVNYIICVTCLITISPPALPSATPGVPYSETITASGGTPPYTFAVTSGALPPLLTLNSATGVISGTPTTIGAFNFCITVTDVNANACTQCYTIIVATGGPALTGWGMFVLSVLLVAVGWVMMRRGGLE